MNISIYIKETIIIALIVFFFLAVYKLFKKRDIKINLNISPAFLFLFIALLFFFVLFLNIMRYHSYSFVIDTPRIYQMNYNLAEHGAISSSIEGVTIAAGFLKLPIYEWEKYSNHFWEHRPFLMFALYYIVFSIFGSSYIVFIFVFNFMLFIALIPLYLLFENNIKNFSNILILIFSISFLFLYMNMVHTITLFFLFFFTYFYFKNQPNNSFLISIIGILFNEQLILFYSLFYFYYIVRNKTIKPFIYIGIYFLYYLFNKYGFEHLTGMSWIAGSGFDFYLLFDKNNWVMLVNIVVILTSIFLFLPLKNKFTLLALAVYMVLFTMSGRIARYTTFHTVYSGFLMSFIIYGFVKEFNKLKNKKLFVLLLIPANLILLYYKGPLPFTYRYLRQKSENNLAQYVPSLHDNARTLMIQKIIDYNEFKPSVLCPPYAYMKLIPEVRYIFPSPYIEEYNFWLENHIVMIDFYDESLLKSASHTVYDKVVKNFYSVLKGDDFNLLDYKDGIFLFIKKEWAEEHNIKYKTYVYESTDDFDVLKKTRSELVKKALFHKNYY